MWISFLPERVMWRRRVAGHSVEMVVKTEIGRKGDAVDTVRGRAS